jgi:glutathionyl-hydroquinone reductase
MTKNVKIATAEQYDNLSKEQLLRMMYVGALNQGQQMGQILTIVQTIVDLLAMRLNVEEREKLQQTDLSPEPIHAIQRRIEETQHELYEDLQNGLYDSGI